MLYLVEQFPSFNPSPSSSIQVKTRATFFKCLHMSITKALGELFSSPAKLEQKKSQSLAGFILQFIFTFLVAWILFENHSLAKGQSTNNLCHA